MPEESRSGKYPTREKVPHENPSPQAIKDQAGKRFDNWVCLRVDLLDDVQKGRPEIDFPCKYGPLGGPSSKPLFCGGVPSDSTREVKEGSPVSGVPNTRPMRGFPSWPVRRDPPSSVGISTWESKVPPPMPPPPRNKALLRDY